MKSDTLILSMNWIFPSTTSLGDRDCKRDILATSDSEGDIVLHYFSTPEYKYQNLSRLPKTSKHSDQAWCVAWTVDTKNFNRPILLSGGDDSQLLKHEFLRCIQQNGTPFVKLLSTEADCKTHMGGVTAIMPFPFYATEERLLVLTGSYDDHVRVYNVGDKKRRVLCELNLGGGVWKLRILRDIAKEQMILAKKDIIRFEKEAENRRKSELASEYAKVHPLACRRSQVPEPPPDPSTVPLHFLVIASCMHAGVRILDIQRDGQKNWSIEVVGKFEEGKSMAYAASASPLTDGDGQRYKGRVMCASTSFYDEKGFVWMWK
jgi:diphthine methyl ester acylhydrolase